MPRPTRFWPLFFAIAVVLGQWWAAQAGPPEYAAERADMVEKMRPGITNQYVLAAMRRVPRHRFVSPADRPRAYDDVNIPVSDGQVIRQPSVVAITMENLGLRPGQKILQVGTECAYCTAILCDIPLHVYVIDIRRDLIQLAKSRLDALGYSSAKWRSGNACRGWREQGPYDAILVMCAANGVPDALVDQLKPGGRMVIPIGEGPEQTLECVVKRPDGKLRTEVIKTPTPLQAMPMTCQQPLP